MLDLGDRQGIRLCARDTASLVNEGVVRERVLGPSPHEVSRHDDDYEYHHGHDLFDDAVRVVTDTGQASISMVQRRLRVGYTRAARLIEMMELK
ncbi:MAG: hypothetical protein IIC24_07315, partial [Chloroflexi bacterium]|nr:hypothetical protein [Chloroflexota bacterium]